MNLYLARKDNVQFYIQPDMAEMYSKQGYTIIKLEEVVLNDTQISEISTQSSQQEVEVINAG